MSTTFDTIYSYFLRNTSVDTLDLPSFFEAEVNLVRDGIDEFNYRLEKNLVYDSENNVIMSDLSNTEIKCITECMKLIVLRNMLEQFVSVWEVFQNDVGRKNYAQQLAGRQNLIDRQEQYIENLIHKLYEDFETGDV